MLKSKQPNLESKLFKFRSDISDIKLPTQLNNPFSINPPVIARRAAEEFQQFITNEFQHWNYNLSTRLGKMFGVLVVRDRHGNLGYLGTISGNVDRLQVSEELVPSVYCDVQGSGWLFESMTGITKLGKQIENCTDPFEKKKLINKRSISSYNIQQELFKKYVFTSITRKQKNVQQIFQDFGKNSPPAAAGDCSAPKLLQFAFDNDLDPVAIAEFWYGNPPKGRERKHLNYYPACLDKCKPILQFMLADNDLFQKAKTA